MSKSSTKNRSLGVDVGIFWCGPRIADCCDTIARAAKDAHASEGGASDAVLAVTLLGGFVTNLVYCSILLTRNRTWSGYRLPGTASHWFLAALMGVTWVMS